MNFFRIFRRRQHSVPRSLRIDGVRTPLTAAPDDREIAAQALLETLSGGADGKPAEKPAEGTAEYYQELSRRIGEKRAADIRRAQRLLTYTEEQLKGHPSADALVDLDHGLFTVQDCVEREGGSLLGRWQHCLAEVIVLQMKDTLGVSRDIETDNQKEE